MKNKFTAVAGIALLALFTSACEKKQQASTEKPPVVAGVKLGKIEATDLDDFYEATGTVRSKTSTILSSKIMGVVRSLRVREGDRVSAHQILIEIDNREAAAQLQKAQAGLRQAQEAVVEVEQNIGASQSARVSAEANKRLAEATLTRYLVLLERKSVSPQEFDEIKARAQVAEAEAERADRMLQMLAARKKQAQAQIDQAKADIASAQVLAGDARITSPLNGVVTARQTEVGSTATPGAPLLTVEDSSRYRFEANVEESQVGRIKLRDRARVRIDSLGADELEGVVAEVAPAADPMSRSYTVKIDLPPRMQMRSGLYGAAKFLRGRKQVMAIPGKAIVQRGQLTGVFVVDDANLARLRLIKTGKTFGDRVEVLSGLKEGELIVIDGVARVNDGNQVR